MYEILQELKAFHLSVYCYVTPISRVTDIKEITYNENDTFVNMP